MENSDLSLTNPVVQVEVLKERLKHEEEKSSQHKALRVPVSDLIEEVLEDRTD